MPNDKKTENITKNAFPHTNRLKSSSEEVLNSFTIASRSPESLCKVLSNPNKEARNVYNNNHHSYGNSNSKNSPQNIIRKASIHSINIPYNSNNNFPYNTNNKSTASNDKSPYSTSPESNDGASYNEMVERLNYLHKDFITNITSIMEDFVTLTKAEMLKVCTNHQDNRHTGEGVVFHLDRKWGIIDLGNHDHVFFDLSILLGSVEDMRGLFQVGEKLAFEAVKALKPSRANWKATSIWKVSKPLPPVAPTYANSTISTIRHSASHDKLSSKRALGSCDSTPLFGNWRTRRSTQYSLNENTPTSIELQDPFRRAKKSESNNFYKNFSNTCNILNTRSTKKTDSLFPTFPTLPTLTDTIKLSPCTFFKPPNLQKLNLPTLDSDICVVDEYNSKRLLKKQQQQEQKNQQQQQNQQQLQIEQQKQQKLQQQQLEERLTQLQQQYELLKQQLQQRRSSENSPCDGHVSMMSELLKDGGGEGDSGGKGRGGGKDDGEDGQKIVGGKDLGGEKEGGIIGGEKEGVLRVDLNNNIDKISDHDVLKKNGSLSDDKKNGLKSGKITSKTEKCDLKSAKNEWTEVENDTKKRNGDIIINEES